MKAKELLKSRGEKYQELSIEDHPILREFLIVNQLHTVPQIWFKGDLIGSYTDLEQWLDWEDSFKAARIEEEEE